MLNAAVPIQLPFGWTVYNGREKFRELRRNLRFSRFVNIYAATVESLDMIGRSREAIDTLETCLLAEAEFFACFADELEQSGHKDRISDLRHENTFHVARIFFLLMAFECTNEQALERFLSHHNRDVWGEMDLHEDGSPRYRELEKAIFRSPRVFKMKAYFAAATEPAFGPTDLADLLFGQMRRTTALNYIEALRATGFLKAQEIDLEHGDQSGQPPKGAQNSAKVIVSTGKLEDLYSKYLLSIRDNITNSTKPAVDLV